MDGVAHVHTFVSFLSWMTVAMVAVAVLIVAADGCSDDSRDDT